MSDMLLLRRRVMMAGKPPRLPREYQEVEFIESTGTQWIDTGIYPNNSSAYDTLGEILFTTVDREQYFLGCDSINTLHNRLSFFGLYQQKAVIGRSSWEWASAALYTNKWYTFKSFNGQGYQDFYINGELLHTAHMSQTGEFLSNIKIFGNNVDYNSRFGAIGRSKEMKIYKDNNLIFKGVPCYRKADHKPGMFDLVTKTFFTNSGTGEFLVGPDVN